MPLQQIQKVKVKGDSVRDEQTQPKTDEQKASEEKLKADLDDILDEIDSVLETNAQAFVQSFQQWGGQ